jgi:hypothetical protein
MEQCVVDSIKMSLLEVMHVIVIYQKPAAAGIIKAVM